MQNVCFMDVPTAVTSFPGNGTGSRIIPQTVPGDTVTSGSEVYTTTNVTATWTASPVAATAGTYVSTSDGHWAVVVSATATVVTVDYWRSISRISKSDTPAVPAAASTARVWSGKCHLTGSTRPKILQIELTKQTANDTLAITDQFGTAIYTYTVPAVPIMTVLDFRDSAGGGFFTPGPFGIKCSAANTQCIVTYVP